MKELALGTLMILILFSCGDDNKDLVLNFKLENNSEPVVMFQEYEFGGTGGLPFELTRFSFFVSDVNATIDGETQNFKEVDYVDLSESHSSLEKAQEGFEYMIGETEGEATAVSFNIGLTSDQNSTLPTDYPSSNVMSRTSEYWSGWNSYVFIKMEGNIDMDGDGVKEKGFALHLGTDEVMRPTSGAYSDNQTLTFDLQKIFSCNGDIYDIEGTPMIHSLSQIDKAIELADNIACSISYE